LKVAFAILAKRLSKFAVDNSPAILTAMGVTGALATAYLTGAASFKAAEILAREERAAVPEEGVENAPFTFRDKFDLTWKLYVPAAGSAAMTVASIVMANRIGTRRAAALATAYGLSERALETYKKKVLETVGPKKAQTITDEIAKDAVLASPPGQTNVIITDRGDHRCLDMYSRRYFTSSTDAIMKAEIDMNWKIINEGHASLSDWYDLLGLEHTTGSDNFGWTDRKFEIDRTYVGDEYDRPCLAVDFKRAPESKFYKGHR
jgi:hypothetical protein